MALTLAQLIAKRDGLQDTLDTGVDNIAEGDKRVGYRSAADLAAQIDGLNRRIEAAENKITTTRVLPQHSKGWG